jgi:hypothetical protein
VTKLRLFVVCGAVASVLTVAAPASALGPIHHQAERVGVPGKVTGLVVRGEVGNIKVVPGSVTRIVATEQWNLEAPKLRHTLRDGLLRVSAPCPRTTGIVDLGLNNCAVGFVITVPRDVTVDARDSVGDILTRDLRGPESLHSDVGNVVVDNVRATEIKASSSTGDVSLTVPAGVYAVDVHSDIGDAHVRGITVQSDAARKLTARTDTGDIRIIGR